MVMLRVLIVYDNFTTIAAESNAPIDPIRIISIGDSITQATGSVGTDGAYSWRHDLWLRLFDGNYEVDFVGTWDFAYTSTPSYPNHVSGQPLIAIMSHAGDGRLMIFSAVLVHALLIL